MRKRSWPEAMLHSAVTSWLAVVLAAIFFLFSNLPWQLDDYDQAKQAFTSFEMVREGHWLFQSTPHGRVATKPPLVGWISAGLFEITRSWEWAWRLPSLLSAAALAALLFRLGKWCAPFGGLIAFGAFSFNLLTPRLATLVRTDMPLAFIICLIGALIWQKIRDNSDWTFTDRLQIFGLLTAGMLIKGPVVYAFLLPGIVAFQWCRRDASSSAWPGWWPWVASLGIFLVWVGTGIRSVPEFYDEVVIREFLGRFGGEIHRSQPWFFYLPHLLHKFAPWSVLMIALAVLLFPGWGSGWRTFWRNISPDIFWLLCWSMGGLLLMSLFPSKRVDRIFPVVPPLCLLLAAQIGDGLTVPEVRKRIYRWSAVALVAAFVFTGGYAVWKVGRGFKDNRNALAEFGVRVREEAAAHQWRYGAVSGPDEGMLLYLRKLHFLKRESAITQWNSGLLDALVVKTPEANELMGELKGAVLSPVRSAPRPDGDNVDYVLLVRRGVWE